MTREETVAVIAERLAAVLDPMVGADFVAQKAVEAGILDVLKERDRAVLEGPLARIKYLEGLLCSYDVQADAAQKLGLDGRHLPAHAVMWAVVNGRVCRKQHTDNQHDWEYVTFSPAWCREPAPEGWEVCERPAGHTGNHEAGLGLTVWCQEAKP